METEQTIQIQKQIEQALQNVHNKPCRKLSIICFSGDFDKALAAYTLASGAAAVNWQVNMFFTFWGLMLLKKDGGRKPLGNSLLSKAFNFLCGGKDAAPLSRLNFGGISPQLMKTMMKKSNVASLDELISASHELGVDMYACEMAMHILDIKKSDLQVEIKDVIGVASFLKMSEDAQVIFI